MAATAVGFIGLGVMGGPMARNLIKASYPVTGFDTDRNRLDRFVAAGGKPAASAVEVGRASEIVMLSLPTGDVVRQVVTGEGGLAAAMKSGTAIVDCSTTEPKVAQDSAGVCAQRGIAFLDAPVSGGEQGAVEASLSIMVGGDAAAFARCRPILSAMGRSVVHLGGSGMGQAAKLINNLIVAAGFAAVCEGWALAVKAGLDPATLHEAIKGGWAGSRVMEETVPRLLHRNFIPGGTVDIMAKDVGYALNMARTLDMPVPVTALVHELFRMAKSQGKGPKAQPVLITLWEEWTGIRVGGKQA
ncbi:MAG TPA: NAD(P)-dependent oxidoreductase [Candidatus Methylomirabilis sp.]|nr:NAD(P)-dependent oxidoreductase [Candidatus Methylomirabilis sp.]HSD51673.1 NAD(P)-dependent oxidoreductase [Candidatus Methylomirabilis sp.]